MKTLTYFKELRSFCCRPTASITEFNSLLTDTYAISCIQKPWWKLYSNDILESNFILFTSNDIKQTTSVWLNKTNSRFFNSAYEFEIWLYTIITFTMLSILQVKLSSCLISNINTERYISVNINKKAIPYIVTEWRLLLQY